MDKPFYEYVAYIALLGFGFLARSTLNELKVSVIEATKGINDLNKKMEKFIEKVETNEKSILKLEEKVEDIEKNMGTVRERLHVLGNAVNKIEHKDLISWVKPEKHA